MRLNIPNSVYKSYTKALDMQIAEGTTRLGAFIDSMKWTVGYAERKALRNMVIEEAYALFELYGLAAATVAADFYDEIAALSGENLQESMFPELPSMDSMAASIRNDARSLWGENSSVDQFRVNAQATLKKYMRDFANDTIIKNALRDKKKSKGLRWARVPRGLEPCPWCMMLASRGFDYVTKESAQLYGHSHANCQCDVICSFSNGEIEGYDYSEYEKFYNDHLVYDGYGHVDANATEKWMREDYYAENRDHINEVRRAWYARNSEREISRLSKYKTKEYKEMKEAEKQELLERIEKEKERLRKLYGPTLEAHDKALENGIIPSSWF